MFTGIVQSQAEVYSNKIEQGVAKLLLQVTPELIEGLETGASVAVNGVCLTVVEFYLRDAKGYIAFDVIEESLSITNLAELVKGSLVNIERSLKVGDELGGHIVSGHVHCQTELIERIEQAANCSLRFKTPVSHSKFLLEKGFIAINGISLTLGEVNDDSFVVHLIPETIQRTNLSDLSKGGAVNLEFDQQTITIVTTLERMKLSL